MRGNRYSGYVIYARQIGAHWFFLNNTPVSDFRGEGYKRDRYTYESVSTKFILSK